MKIQRCGACGREVTEPGNKVGLPCSYCGDGEIIPSPKTYTTGNRERELTRDLLYKIGIGEIRIDSTQHAITDIINSYDSEEKAILLAHMAALIEGINETTNQEEEKNNEE